jgi:hypothetical protein
MSEMPQGPGWWLASDGRWYPPETAPPGLFEGAYPGYRAYYWDPASPNPPTVQPEQQPPASEGPWAEEPSTPGPEVSSLGPAHETPDPTSPARQFPDPASDPVPGSSEPVGLAPGNLALTPPLEVPGAPPGDLRIDPQGAPTHPAPSDGSSPVAARGSNRWRPWLAMVGIALVIWGAGQGLLAWAQWRLVRRQLAALGTVSQGHLGLALTAAGILIAGLATLALSATVGRR